MLLFIRLHDTSLILISKCWLDDQQLDAEPWFNSSGLGPNSMGSWAFNLMQRPTKDHLRSVLVHPKKIRELLPYTIVLYSEFDIINHNRQLIIKWLRLNKKLPNYNLSKGYISHSTYNIYYKKKFKNYFTLFIFASRHSHTKYTI